VNPSLPQNDSDRAARQAALEEARRTYRYDYEAYPPLALAAEVPPQDEPPPGWKLRASEKMVALGINSAKVDDAEGVTAAHHAAMAALITAERSGGMKAALNELNRLIKEGESSGRPAGLESYRELFQEIELPAVAGTYREDATFAEERVSGANPMWIRRVDAMPEHFPVTEAHFQAALDFQGALGEGDSLEAARQEGRLYLADYAVLAEAEGGTYPDGQKYVTPSMALFAVPPAGAADRRLKPVAIQSGQTPSAETPVLTPRDGDAWLIAKTRVQTADGNVHQAISHLGHTHMVVEPFVLATHRQLAPTHPLHVLLSPHFEGTLSINESANTTLLAPKGGVDMVMAGTIGYSREVAASAASSWRFDAARFPTDLATRGVDDPDALPHYPYRDDGRLIWDAIHAWVDAYVRLYYPSDAEVVADTELQAWAAEVISPEGGRIKGFGQEGRLQTRDYLIDALTHLLYTGSAQHAAVNFPQFTSMSFVPNWPLASYTPLGGGSSAQDYLDLLPPMDAAHMQMSLGYLLGTLYYSELGNYPHHDVFFEYFSDRRVHAPAKQFRETLDGVEAVIHGRNATRPVVYPHLLPSKIPQSINI